MPTDGPALDAARALTVERNLVRRAFEYLTVDAFTALPFESLGPTKTLLKRFFSSEPWRAADEEALAAAVGPGEGTWRRQLDPDLTLEYGWHGGRFGVRVSANLPETTPAAPAAAVPGASLSATFDGPVVPEATPNPRTIRFRVGQLHDGASRWYPTAGAAEDDPRVARLFREFEDVTNVLVGPDFVAVSLRRPTDWERLLGPVLEAVTEAFSEDGGEINGGAAASVAPGPAVGTSASPRRSRLELAWRDLGGLRPSEPGDLALIVAAAHSKNSVHRQVAANLLREADPDEAAAQWAGLLADPVRSVRRATVDAMVDVGRQPLRPLLEKALGDTDAWVRWKALRGLVELGPEPSRSAIEPCADDADFRVRLEASAALRAGR